jgi:hypothetical protein
MSKYGTDVTWSSTDINSVSERKLRTLGEMMLALLMRSGLPKQYWFDAYLAAVHITLRLPTRTRRRWCTLYECCYGTVPSLGRLRVWGCKAFDLKPEKGLGGESPDGVFYRLLVGQGWLDHLVARIQKDGYQRPCFIRRAAPPSRPDDYYKEIDDSII